MCMWNKFPSIWKIKREINVAIIQVVLYLWLMWSVIEMPEECAQETSNAFIQCANKSIKWIIAYK